MSVGRESDPSGLEPLPDLPEHEPLAELPPEAEAPPTGTPPASAARGPSKPRELERAPIVLRKAALILAIASLFPWLQPGGWTLDGILGKAIVALGGYVFYTAVLYRHGEPVPGALAKLVGGMHRLALDILAVLVALVGLFFTWREPLGFAPVVERASLAVGLAAWCQVLDYEKGGKFNPVLGLTIPLFGIAALVRLITVFTAFDPKSDVFTALGDLGVLAAAGIAGYTMFIAMKEAKAHGEAKKRAAQEARMAARKTRTAGGPPPPRPPGAPRAGGGG